MKLLGVAHTFTAAYALVAKEARQEIQAEAAWSSGTLPTALTIDSGPIFGFRASVVNTTATVNKYFGIPFAAPVVRFAPPRKPCRWTNPLNTTQPGPICIQSFVTGDVGTDPELIRTFFNNPQLTEGEASCLTLNVIAPSSPGPRGGRAVMVIIPGGGFQLGGGAGYDGTSFAAYEDIITVSINYRTNVFGFPGDPSIPPTERNLGLLDQRLALDWIQRNIRVFGGDPAKVTVHGVSAGALSIDAHLTAFQGPYGASPRSPPFRAAILESGQFSYGFTAMHDPAGNSASWSSLLALANCTGAGASGLACMRRVPAATIRSLLETNSITFWPEVDNFTVVDRGAAARAAGRLAKVPVLEGTAADEGRLLVNHNITMDAFAAAYLPPSLFPPELKEQILAVYRSLPGVTTDFDIAAPLYTDFLWQCPQGMHANATVAAGQKAYRYFFNSTILELLPPEYSWLRVFHGSDALLIFSDPSWPFTERNRQIGASMRGAFARFVKNPGSGPGWPAVGSAAKDIAVWGDLGASSGGVLTLVEQKAVDARCALYKSVFDILKTITG